MHRIVEGGGKGDGIREGRRLNRRGQVMEQMGQEIREGWNRRGERWNKKVCACGWDKRVGGTEEQRCGTVYSTVERERTEGCMEVDGTVEDRGGEIREKRSGIRASRCGIIWERWWNRARERVEQYPDDTEGAWNSKGEWEE